MPNQEETKKQEGLGGPILQFIIAQVLVLALVGVFIVGLGRIGGVGDPGIFALVLVLSVVFLMTTLFILASGYSRLELTDPNQPLGLPGGSVRAMIALILILVFIMFGAYLYTQELTYAPTGYGPIEMTREQYLSLPNVISAEPVSGTTDRYDVYFADPDVRNSSQLAQQLLTTVGTLVVAVAGFYFGSAATTGLGTSGKDTLSAGPDTNTNGTDVPPPADLVIVPPPVEPDVVPPPVEPVVVIVPPEPDAGPSPPEPDGPSPAEPGAGPSAAGPGAVIPPAGPVAG